MKIVLGILVCLLGFGVLSVFVFFMSRAAALGSYAAKQKIESLKVKKEEIDE